SVSGVVFCEFCYPQYPFALLLETACDVERLPDRQEVSIDQPGIANWLVTQRPSHRRSLEPNRSACGPNARSEKSHAGSKVLTPPWLPLREQTSARSDDAELSALEAMIAAAEATRWRRSLEEPIPADVADIIAE